MKYERIMPRTNRIVQWMSGKNVDRQNQLSISYSIPAEVEWRNKFKTNHKKKLLLKFSNMRQNGQGLKVMGKLERWLNLNVESLYDDEAIRNKFMQMTIDVRRRKPKRMPEEDYKR